MKLSYAIEIIARNKKRDVYLSLAHRDKGRDRRHLFTISQYTISPDKKVFLFRHVKKEKLGVLLIGISSLQPILSAIYHRINAEDLWEGHYHFSATITEEMPHVKGFQSFFSPKYHPSLPGYLLDTQLVRQ